MNLSLLLYFCRQDLIDRYSGSLLGGLWTFITPLVNILIFTLVFSRIMGARLPGLTEEFSQYGYSIYLVAGILSWQAFASTIQRMSGVFAEKAGLIAKVNMSLLALPLHVVVTESIIFVISMAFFVGFLLLIGFPITSSWLFLPLVFVVQQLLAYALGFLLATLAVFIRDVATFVTVSLQLWFWLTPIVYTVDILAPDAVPLFATNPMFHVVGAHRDIVLRHEAPDLAALGVLALIGATLLAASIWVFGKLERDLRDLV